MPDVDTVRSWQGATLVDRDGDRVGTVAAPRPAEHQLISAAAVQRRAMPAATGSAIGSARMLASLLGRSL